jgi:hypothetical protein
MRQLLNTLALALQPRRRAMRARLAAYSVTYPLRPLA